MRLFFALLPFWGMIGLALCGYLFILPDLSLRNVGADPYIWSVWGGSFYLAGGACAISLILGSVTALVLDHLGVFPGRDLLLRLYRLCFIMPILIVIYAIISFYGYQGWIQIALKSLFGADMFPGWHIYGIGGIWLVMVFANFPYAALIFLSGFSAIHPNNRRLAAQLSFSLWQKIRWLYLPVMVRQVGGLGGLIFVLCFTSFAPVLILGGGPKYATLEVAIYQALRFDFDLGQTVFLSVLQIGSCLSFILILWISRRFLPFWHHSQKQSQKQDMYLWRQNNVGQGPEKYVGHRISVFAIIWILLTTFLLMAPLMTILADGARGPVSTVLQMSVFWQALLGSTMIALIASILAVLMSLIILFTLRAGLEAGYQADLLLVSMNRLDRYALILLAFPPLTLSAGLFLVLRNGVPVLELGLYIAIIVQAILSIPYILKLIIPAFQQASQQYGPLARQLDLSFWARCRYVDGPLLCRPLGLAFGISAAFAAGDLAIISLFGSQDVQTLPLLLYRLSGAYRVDAAAVVAVSLIIFCLILFWLGDKGMRKAITYWAEKG